MDNKIKRVYIPMTKTGFYILFCLQKPQHGYGIIQKVRELTEGRTVHQPRNYVRNAIKDGKRRTDFFCLGR